MPTVQCMGETFEVWPEISAWAFADFAEAMNTSGDSDEINPRTISAMMSLLQDCVVPDEWDRFKQHTRVKRATFADLMQVVRDMTQANTDRPTGRSSDSSDGPPTTDQKSASPSASKGLERFAGRPDLQLAVLRQQGAA